MFDLSGRVACITGAASGIGEAAAETLAAAGAAVALGDIDGEGAARTRDRILGGGGRAVAMPVDTTHADQVSALVAAAADEFGRLDVMANVAGVGSYGDVVNVTEAELDRVLAINFKGVFFGCQAAMRVMAPQGSGSIVNVSATAINTPVGGLSVYAATKAAVAMLTQSLAVEAGSSGVRVNTIAPGFTLTNFVGGHLRDADGQVDPRGDGQLPKADARPLPAGRGVRGVRPGQPDLVPGLRCLPLRDRPDPAGQCRPEHRLVMGFDEP